MSYRVKDCAWEVHASQSLAFGPNFSRLKTRLRAYRKDTKCLHRDFCHTSDCKCVSPFEGIALLLLCDFVQILAFQFRSKTPDASQGCYFSFCDDAAPSQCFPKSWICVIQSISAWFKEICKSGFGWASVGCSNPVCRSLGPEANSMQL